jgi:hypothetical protein
MAMPDPLIRDFQRSLPSVAAGSGMPFAPVEVRGPPRGGAFTSQLMQELNMLAITQVPIVVAAAQYSLIYLLLGGGFGGAIVIYIVAKMMGK